MPLINLYHYLKVQSQETNRACILFAPAMGGKTALAQRLRERLGTAVYDLQADFLANPELCARIDTFSPADLFTRLLALPTPESLVVVDHLDFLLNTWTPAKKKAFLNTIDLKLKSPDATTKTFIFLVQDDPAIIGHKLVNSHKDARILPVGAFENL